METTATSGQAAEALSVRIISREMPLLCGA